MDRKRLFTGAALGAAAMLALSAILIGLAGSSTQTAPQGFPRDAEMDDALGGAREPFRALHAKRGELLPGEVARHIEQLRGYPLVVNAWGTWCGPCRAEFPMLARVSTDLGRHVAFLGVNTMDVDARARRFLRANPVAYPSYIDPDGRFLKRVGALGLPFTVFINRRGERHVHQGGFDSAGELRRAVRRYALM